MLSSIHQKLKNPPSNSVTVVVKPRRDTTEKGGKKKGECEDGWSFFGGGFGLFPNRVFLEGGEKDRKPARGCPPFSVVEFFAVKITLSRFSLDLPYPQSCLLRFPPPLPLSSPSLLLPPLPPSLLVPHPPPFREGGRACTCLRRFPAPS